MADRATTDARFQPPEVRRRQILDAARRLAVTEGLSGTSIARVASEAGLAKGSIYLHFDSREALVAALQADVWSRLLDHPRAIVADEARAWEERLDAVVEHLMRFEFDEHELYHAVFHSVATDRDEPWDEAREVVGDLIRGGVAAGAFDLDDLDPALVVDFALHGYLGPCFHHADHEEAIHGVQRLFRRLVGAPA